MLNDIFTLMLGFFSDKFTQHTDTVSQLSKEALDRIASSLMKVLTTGLLFAIGLSTVMLDITMSSYSNGGHLAISEVSAVGGGLAIIPLLAFSIFALKRSSKASEATAQRAQAQTSPTQLQLGPLSEAVSLYILDLVEERKFNRARVSPATEQAEA